MGTKRDDFAKNTINVLRERVAGRCSNPNCRVPTTGPTKDDSRFNNIGIGAHITAASPGGPRYDETLSPKERRSITNGIWLCAKCSKIIDSDAEKYTVSILKGWKNKAEDNAAKELGERLPGDKYVVQSLGAALSGQSTTFFPKLLSNASEATSKALESLDQRFSVRTSFSNSISRFEIFAKENIESKFFINPSFKAEFREKYINLIEHGEKLSIDSEAIRIAGSPLLDEMQNSVQGKFEFSTTLQKDATVSVWLTSPDSKSEIRLNDFWGEVSLGNKSFSIKCGGLKDHVLMTIRFFHQDLFPTKGFLGFNLNFFKWDRNFLSQLPYLDKLYRFYDNIKNGWVFKFKIEIDGYHILSGNCPNIGLDEQFNRDYYHLSFIFMVREISRIVKSSIFYDDSYAYPSQFYFYIKEVFEVLKFGICIRNVNFEKNAHCTLEVSPDLANLDELKEMEGKKMEIRFEQKEADVISPFNQDVILPKFSHYLTEVVPIFNIDFLKVKAGDLVEVEWKPLENCLYKIEAI